MRRKDREVREKAEIITILEHCPVLRIAISDVTAPYIVPVFYAWTWEGDLPILYFHSAAEGRKVDLLHNSPKIGFEMDQLIDITKHEQPCKWDAHFESVIGEGSASLIENESEKKNALDLIMVRYGGQGPEEYHPATFKHMTVFKIEVTALAAKHDVAQ